MASSSGERRVATASYIENMLAELRTMGQQIDCDFLVYLLEMAMFEACDVAAGKVTEGRKSVVVTETRQTPSAEQLASIYLAGQLDR